MSWALEDHQCDINVTGTLVNDPIRGESLEVVFALREVRLMHSILLLLTIRDMYRLRLFPVRRQKHGMLRKPVHPSLQLLDVRRQFIEAIVHQSGLHRLGKLRPLLRPLLQPLSRPHPPILQIKARALYS